jgi:hypothetical protein
MKVEGIRCERQGEDRVTLWITRLVKSFQMTT